MTKSNLSDQTKPNRIRRYSMSVIGVLVASLIVASAAGVYFLNASAIGPSAAEARIQGWVNQLDSEQLTPVRHLAQQNLEQAGDAAVDPLVAALHSRDSALRRNSAEMLGFIASPSALDALATTMADDPVAAVRSRAAWSLGELHDLRAVGPLEETSVRDQDVRVRQEASASLDAIRAYLASVAGKDDQVTGAFAIAPSSNSIVYIAEMNQVSISHDGGKTWGLTGGSLPSRVSALAVSPTNPNIVYAGTESLGLYESTDGGTTWVAKNQGLGLKPGVRLTVTAIALDPLDASHVYVATGAWVGADQAVLTPMGVMHSVDGGNSWKEAGLPSGVAPVSRLVIYRNELFASAGAQVKSFPL